MPKLIKTFEAMKPFPYQETWMSDNDLIIGTSYYDEIIFLSVDTKSGDVADQIYEILIQDERFKNIKLDTGSCYFIKIEKKQLDNFFEVAELIDVKKLKEGKRY